MPLLGVYESFLKHGDILGYLYPLDPDFYIPKRIGPITYLTIYLYMKYPSAKLESDFYLRPFDKTLWVVVISSLFLGTMLVVFLNIFSKNERYCLAENIFSVSGIFCNQSNEEGNETNSLKIVLLMMNILGFVIVNSFGAVITAFLSVKIPIIPFNNLEEFGKDGGYILQLYRRGDLHKFLEVHDYGTERYREL